MAETERNKKGFRWGRFVVTFLVLYALYALGTCDKGSADEQSPKGPLAISYAVGQLIGLLGLTFVIYGIDSLILRRRNKKSDQISAEGSPNTKS